MRRTIKQRRGYGWTWEFQPEHDGEWVLCNWAAPFRSLLEDDNSKPCDDARPVRVELVPTNARTRKRYGYE